MGTVENYLKDPHINYYIRSPLENKKIFQVYSLIEELAKYKANCLKDKYEELDIPNDAIFNWEEQSVTLIYNPRDNEEDDEIKKDIYNLLFILNIEYEHILLLIYSQIEATLKKRIKQKNKNNEFNKFKKKKRNDSDIIKLYEYNIQLGHAEILKNNKKDFDDVMKYLENFMRKKRNSIAHGSILVPNENSIRDILSSSINSAIIIEYLNCYFEKIEVLLIEFKLTLIMFDKIFDFN